jgi:hypothetical protein
VTVEEFLGDLEKVRRNGAGWIARCPAHEDRSPSLSVREGDDGSRVWRREIACGGDPQRALVRALATSPVRRGEVWSFGITHDTGCPALDGAGMPSCTCELVGLEARRAA